MTGGSTDQAIAAIHPSLCDRSGEERTNTTKLLVIYSTYNETLLCDALCS